MMNVQAQDEREDDAVENAVFSQLESKSYLKEICTWLEHMEVLFSFMEYFYTFFTNILLWNLPITDIVFLLLCDLKL